MRILFTSHPAVGHLNPLLPIARAAEDAGHDVLFAVSARFTSIVEAAGFRAVPAGLPWLESDKSTVPPELRPDPNGTLEAYFAQQFVAAPAALLAKDIVTGSDRPDVIVRERTEFGGAIAADALGIPCAAVQVGSPDLFTAELMDACSSPYQRARADLDIPPDPGLEQLLAQVVFATAPRSLHGPSAFPSSTAWLRPTALDHDAGEGLAPWIDDLGVDRPLVYATLGTVFNDPSFDLPFFPVVIAGLGSEPLDVVITVGRDVEPAVLGPTPSNVRVEHYVPQSLLFPRCAAIVCHGGYGTLLAAIEHGVPLVVVPFGADQSLNAATVERAGIGIAIDDDRLTADRLRTAVRSLIDDPSWRTRIGVLRDEAAGQAPVAFAIETLVGLAGGR